MSRELPEIAKLAMRALACIEEAVTRFPRRRADLERLRSVWSSYAGHFSHANSYRLRGRLFRRYRWLAAALQDEAA